MSFPARLFLESPLYLAIFCFLIFAAALLLRRRLEGRSRDVILPAALVLIPSLFLLQHLVVTQREEVRQTVDAFIAAIERKEAAAIGSAISDEYQSEDMDRGRILALIESWLARARVYDTRVSSVDIVIRGQHAEILFLARATVAIDSGAGEPHWGRWKLGLVREAGEWRIAAIEPVMLDGVAVRRLSDIHPP